ncbi:MAG: neuraminidase-like domain-containing protein [Terriglobales bacterium]
MATKLIVIRLVPPAPIAATPLGSTPPSFTDYLAQNGGLQIAAYDLSYGNPTTGTLVGTATYSAPKTLPQTSPTPTPPSGFTPTQASYNAGTGIIQQLDVEPAQYLGAVETESPYYTFESVATAIIEFTPASAATFFENLKLVATWQTGGAQAISITQDYYNVPLADGPTPLATNFVTMPAGNTIDAWSALSPSVYLTVPPPATPGSTSFTLPSDGSAPQFDDLLTAVQAILAIDPGGATPDLGKLTFAQCQNIAYEIVWSQQPPLTTPPEPIEDMYTNPPNNGQMMTGGSSPTPNQNEGDRQQFQANLAGYYGLPDANADRLTNFVFSLAAAVACEETSLAATQVYLEFPTNPAETGSPDVEVILQGVGTATSNFGVPAAYFYALGANMPTSMLAPQRYTLALSEGLPQMLAELTAAFNAGTITDAEVFVTSAMPAINAAQAARRMQVLNVPSGSSASTLSLDSTVQNIVTDWLKFANADASPSTQTYQPSDELGFWTTELSAQPAAYLELVLCALTQGYKIPALPNPTLASEIITPANWPVGTPAITSVAVLVTITDTQWEDFFTAQPTWLPPFTQPGNLAAQISNFLTYLQKFFAVTDANVASTIFLVTQLDAKPSDGFGGTVLTFASTAGIVTGMSVSGITTIALGTEVSTPAPTGKQVTIKPALTGDVPAGTTITFTTNYATIGSANGLNLLQGPSTDWLTNCFNSYPGPTYVLGSEKPVAIDPTSLQNAAATLFPNETCIQNWVVAAILTLDALCQLIQQALPGVTANLQFSIAEALYARGFKSSADVTELTSADFQTALTGTVAYDSAAALFAAAQNLSPNTPASPSTGSFTPINPDGSLTNCIPAPCRSPLGPIEYLHEMLQVSPNATCANPSASGTTTLGTVIAQRRGPLGQLAASCANLETPLPMIDLVNECLEFMASTSTVTDNGTVYNTSSDAVAGYELCHEGCLPEEKPDCECHDPKELLSALPEYSTPGTPGVANQQVEPAVWNTLESDTSACCLPYSQAADVSRTYLRHLSTCRFEVMRTFRKCITEFVLAPNSPPTDFESYLWRYPVRIDIAIEYLGITPDEFQVVFGGTWPQPCGSAWANNPTAKKPAARQPAQSFGLKPAAAGDNSEEQTGVQLSQFLQEACLSYCEFIELWKSQFVAFSDGGTEDGKFPDCEPCCLEQHWLQLPNQQTQPTDPNQPQNPPAPAPGATNPPTPAPVAGEGNTVGQLAVFIRLWRKLKDVCNANYTFAQLRDICDVLQLFIGGVINPEFIRQLAAFQMLRDQFRLPLVNSADKPAAGAIDADRTQILALWAGSGAAQYPWAIRQLCEGVERHAQCRHKCDHRPAEFVQMLASNLDALSVLAGFDPTSTTGASWNALPTCTLRFAEVLAKIYASRFHSDDFFYLFTTGAQAETANLFPLQGNDDAVEFPLNLPDDEHQHSLWKLRHKLLEARVSDEDLHHWSWNRLETSLREEFGYSASAVLQLGQHFFPATVQSAGYQVTAQQRRYSSSLPAAQTTPAMWSTPATGPFQYDSTSSGALFIQLPLTDKAVIEQLQQVQQLNTNEQTAVQDLYFQPRATLAAFAFLFVDFAEAQAHLIEEQEEHERWNYFRRQFVLCHARCKILAEHLAAHVDSATHQHHPEGVGDAFIILRELYADENNPGNWQNDTGMPPTIPWPGPNGGAFAALLGLIGTGLLREVAPAGGNVTWRDLSGPLGGFGRESDRMNCPLPTIIPSLGLTLTPAQLANVGMLNGIASSVVSGAWLGGGEGFAVRWSGALLVDHDGVYEFAAGAPTPEDERPNLEAADKCQWRVTITRDGKTRLLLNHNWPGQTGPTVPFPHLKAGAYDITVEFSEPAPPFSNPDEHRLRTGFQVKYKGPDSHDRMIEIPHSHLFRISKKVFYKDEESGYQDLSSGISGLAPGAMNFLNGYYSSTLRDIRRTYQRAFKALLFVHRFPLSSKRRSDGQSELGFMLAQPENFEGQAYYSSGGIYVQHAAYFDFSFLPLVDNYDPPTAAQDSRVQPSTQRTQAMFDWFERRFDYVIARNQVWAEHHSDLWELFEDAQLHNPTNPADLLRHMGARKRDWPIDLRYFLDQGNAPYQVSSSDLTSDPWVVRVWHAERLARMILQGSSDKDVALARPDLWASDDPSGIVDTQGVTGNANLSTFLCDRCFNYDHPRRYEEIRKLNDGLRERGRRALICYLCAEDRVPLPWTTTGQYAQVARDLSDLLLLDVEVGICEKASRIEEAITAVQNFIRRARLGLEPTWQVTCDFVQMWDRHFASFHVWQACKRRHLYKENFIEWEELGKARQIEAFRMLETQLGRDALSIAAPGGLDWWPDSRPPAHHPVELLQRVEPDEIVVLSQEREGFNLLATQERAARPTWLSAVQTTLPPAKTSTSTTSLPFWMESAIGMGQTFYRIAAAGVPPASADCKCLGNPSGACCKECGCKHCPLVDEYYFWLIPCQYYVEPTNPNQNGSSGSATNPDDYQYGFQDDFYSQSDQQSGWQDPTQLPQMLLWNSTPMVRLGWVRVHNGEFQQPRTSSFGVPVVPSTTNDLTFLGRTGDSLMFSVTNPAIPSPPPILGDTSAPGFRYDLASDCAVVLPQVLAPPTPPTFLGGLPAYPFFVYVAPGTHLLPLSLFSPANAVARALRANCSFEAALKWYELAFNPLTSDCTWIDCQQNSGPNLDNNHPSTAKENGGTSTGACCDSTNISFGQTKNRAITLEFLETLKEWGEAEMRGNSPEHFQKARLLFDTIELILGKRPLSILLAEPTTSQTVATYIPDYAPLNPRLMDLYDITRDRLNLIRNCANAFRLGNGHPRCDMPYFGNSPLREGWRTAADACCDENDWCHLHSPYRFTFLIQKAEEYAGKVRELGAELLSAFEKGDAEYLASLHAVQEREILDLQLAARQDQWRDADWQVEALQKTKAVSQTNFSYYTQLIQNNLNGDEIGYQDLTIASTVLRAAGDALEGIAGGMAIGPNTFSGGAGFGGSPLFYMQLPIGEPLSEVFSIAARVMNGLSAIAGSTAGLELTEAGWQRRMEEWQHQVAVLTIEIEQNELQILGAQRRRDSAMQDLNIQQRQIEHSTQVLNFLRDKFTAHDLYLYLQKETLDLHRRMFDLAYRRACQAQRAFNLERGHTTRKFIPECAWNSLQEGLLAGERLDVALRHMEKSYFDENVREYELTKHISLREHFPLEYLRLRTTGYCEVDIPEWMFDQDYPGMYMRRIRCVTMTMPCTTGPFNNVNCRLTLLGSVTRIDPRLDPPAHRCCCDRRHLSEYELCPCDPRAVRQYDAREAIATSSGKNDSGMFEMNFHDERYLPFEYRGVVCRMRIEAPIDNNFRDPDTVADAILCFYHTAREGGPMLRRAANENTRKHLPGEGWCFFDVRHDFPDSWELLRMASSQEQEREKGKEKRHKQLNLRLTRRMFPYVPGCPDLRIEGITLLFEAGQPRHDCCEVGECACLKPKPRDSYEVGLLLKPECEAGRRHDRIEAACVTSEGCSNLYIGEYKINVPRIVGDVPVTFEFPHDVEEISRIFLFCHFAR